MFASVKALAYYLRFLTEKNDVTVSIQLYLLHKWAVLAGLSPLCPSVCFYEVEGDSGLNYQL